jgi:hypothetical protein
MSNRDLKRVEVLAEVLAGRRTVASAAAKTFALDLPCQSGLAYRSFALKVDMTTA